MTGGADVKEAGRTGRGGSAGSPETGRRERRQDRLRCAGGLLAALGCALLAVDDVAPLRALGGGIAASPAWIPLLASGLLLVRGSSIRSHRVLLLSLGAVAIFAIALTVATTPLDAPDTYGQSPAAKGARLCATLVIWLGVLLAGAIAIRAAPRYVAVGAGVALAIMILGAATYQLGWRGLDEWSLLHSSLNAQQRVRSTRFEASSLGAGMIVLSGLLVLSLRSGRLRILAGAVGLLCTLSLTASRGTNLIAAGALVALVLLQILPRRSSSHLIGRARPWVSVAVAVALAAAAVAAALALGTLLTSPTWTALGISDRARGTSDATRAGWADVAGQVLVVAPLGLGLGNYLAETPALLSHAISRLSVAFGPAALAELTRSASGLSGVGVSPKTLPTLAAYYLGWVGLLGVLAAYARSIWTGLRCYADMRQAAPLVLVAASVFASAGYYSSVFSWDQALLLGAAIAATPTGMTTGPRSIRSE